MDRTDFPIPAFTEHPLRATVLAELHARPFAPLPTPSSLLHLAFATDAAAARADRAAFADLCAALGAPGPAEGAKHHRVLQPGFWLRWEQHSEFTTYSFGWTDSPTPFGPPPGPVSALLGSLHQPGPLLVQARLALRPEGGAPALESLFDPSSLVAARTDAGAALVATDFRPDATGSVRLLMLDGGLSPLQAGALAQRLLEIETYRTLALLGLPQAQALAPEVGDIEQALADIATRMGHAEGLEEDRRLLDELTALAARLEAGAAASSFRFGASRAYDTIVQQRLAVIGEQPVDSWPGFAVFLNRRFAPAMRTCQTLESRQADLSQKLSRTANLLRTRVDVAIEQQNRDLLASMNRRTRLQLRMQQTVEGLSVAAISYYVVSLLAHVFEGLHAAHLLPLDPLLAAAVAVPPVVIAVAVAVRRIRRHHGGG